MPDQPRVGSEEATLASGSPSPDGTSIEPPRHLGRYRIDHVLGAGGMGVVLAAHDPELDRAVALKLLHHGDDQSQRRLVREAQAMARLRHPNVVTVHDVGVCDGRVFVAMELIEGNTLRAWLRVTPRSWREIITRFVAAGHGLAAAHAAGIVHRDFKADNVLCGDDGSVRVADFGLAGAEDEGGDGRVMGTPAYMAPEQHDGDPAGPAADQFAFAAALWEALCNTRPFAGASSEELKGAKRAFRVEPPSGSAPRWAFGLLRRAMAPDPAQRHASMAVLVRALERGLRRRRLVITAAVAAAAIGATAAAAIALGGGHDGPSCRLAAAEVERAWNPAARARLASAFGASTRPHAQDTLVRVTAAFDRHATTLGEARVAACEATHVRGTQSAEALDRRTACLDQRIDGMAALATLFGRGVDDDLVDRAYEAVINLPDGEECAAAALSSRPPPTPAQRDRVTAAQARLGEADALRGAGRLADATTAFTTLADDARAIGYAPLLAEVLNGRARTLADAGDVVGGKQAFLDAAAAAAAAADDRLIADAWVGQLGLLAEEGGKPADALEQLAFAEVAVARAGDATVQEAFLVVRSDIYLGLARFAEARADLETAHQRMVSRGAGDTFPASRVLTRLASVMWHLGENDAALDLDRKTLALWNETLGRGHPKVGALMNNVGIRLDKAGHFEEALRILEQSLAIKQRTLGPENASVATSLHNIGMVHDHLGHYAASRAFSERALAMREQVLGPEHPLVASTLGNLSNTYAKERRYDVSLVMLQRAVAIHEKVGGLEHPDLAPRLAGLADTLLELGRHDEALAMARRALAINEKAFGRDGEQVARSLMRLADVYRRLGRSDDACAATTRALGISEQAHGPAHPDLAGPLTGRADCRLAGGDAAGALVDADRAVAIAMATKLAPHKAARAHFVAARALWTRPADRARAHERIAAARAGFAGAPADTLPEVAEIDAWVKRHPRP